MCFVMMSAKLQHCGCPTCRQAEFCYVQGKMLRAKLLESSILLSTITNTGCVYAEQNLPVFCQFLFIYLNTALQRVYMNTHMHGSCNWGNSCRLKVLDHSLKQTLSFIMLRYTCQHSMAFNRPLSQRQNHCVAHYSNYGSALHVQGWVITW